MFAVALGAWSGLSITHPSQGSDKQATGTTSPTIAGRARFWRDRDMSCVWRAWPIAVVVRVDTKLSHPAMNLYGGLAESPRDGGHVATMCLEVRDQPVAQRRASSPEGSSARIPIPQISC